MKNKINKLFKNNSMNLAIMLLGYLLTVLILYSLSSILNINSIFTYIQIISVLIPIIYVIKTKSTKNNRNLGILILVYLTILLIIPFTYNKTYDLTIDGNTYHKTAIAFIKNGWNPLYETSKEFQKTNKAVIEIEDDTKIDLWIEHYPKATWILSANIYNMTGNIESGKSITLIMIIILLIIAYNVLQTFLSRKISLICAILLTLTPITISQIFTYYLDSIMGICFTIQLIILMLINPMKKQSNKLWFILLSICSIFVNLKYTGLLYSGIISAIYYFYWIIKYRKHEKFWKKFGIITRNFVIVYLTAIVLIGANSYLKNTIDHKNPLYPLIGNDKVDIITNMQPKKFEKLSNTEKFIYSIYSKTSNITHNDTKGPTLKNPFKIYEQEKEALELPDTRIGGFGPIFALSFTISIISFIVSLIIIIKEKRNLLKYILLPLSTIIISIIAVGENWWARYIPQLYIFLIGTLILLLYIIKYGKYKKIIKTFIITMLITITINTFILINVSMKKIDTFKTITNDIKEMKTMENLELKTTTKDNYGYYYVLNDNNVYYKKINDIKEKETRYIYSWRIQIKIK